jgi:hypothetical protein
MKRHHKFLLTFVALIIIPVLSYSAVLKALLIIQDNYIDSGLNSIAEDVRLDLGHVQSFLNNLEKGKVIDVEITVLKGKNATYANMEKLLKNVETAKDDVLLFYFSGHGGMDKNKTFLLTADKKFFYRDDIEKLLKSKDAKLKIAVSDACSSSIGGMDARGLFETPEEMAKKENTFVEIYKNLFLNYEGMLYITSASPGEYAWGFGSGGSFTLSFFNEVLFSDPKFTWEEVIDSASKLTQEKYAYMVNMGNLPDAMKKDLKKKGITGQHPYVYSMVSSIDKNITEIVPVPDVNKPETGDILIRNNTSVTLKFYVDNNTSHDSEWSWKYVDTEYIAPGKTVTLKAKKSMLVFFKQERSDYVSYTLKPGKYLFTYNQKDMIDLYTDSGKNSAKKSDVKANPILGKWTWDMWTVEDINKGSKSKNGVLYSIEFKSDNTFTITDSKGKKTDWGKWNSEIASGHEYITIEKQDGKTPIVFKMEVNYLKNSYIQLLPKILNGVEKNTDEVPQIFLYK